VIRFKPFGAAVLELWLAIRRFRFRRTAIAVAELPEWVCRRVVLVG